MSTIVAVAGGSGGLGSAIVNAIRADSRYEVVILARNWNQKLEEATGARVLAVDYSDIDALVKLLEDNKISTIISTINAFMDTTPDMNLIQAADRSKVTRRFIPNLWSAVVYKPEHVSVFPLAGLIFQIQDALKKTSLESTTVFPGIFLDYYVDGLPSHLTKFALVIDVQGNKAGIPGTGNTPITFTYTVDIGRFVAALLGLEKWEPQYHIAGDTKTWHEVLAIVEAAKDVKFDVSYDSIEKLEKGEITELPSHKMAYEMFGGEAAAKPMIQGMMARFGLWMDQGLFKCNDIVRLNDIFPDIKPLTLEQAWKKVGGKL